MTRINSQCTRNAPRHFFKNHEIWPRNDVSSLQMTNSEQISLCWRTMFHMCCCIVNKTWCEALSSRSPGDARLPKCQCVTCPFFIPDFGMFHDYHVIIWPQQLKCHLGKLEQCVGSPWISLVASRSQNRSIENRVRGFHDEESWFSRCLGTNTRTV